jgi:hypothetical protein
MVTATKRAMATNGDNTGNGNSKEGGEQATAATMAMGRGVAQFSSTLTPTGECELRTGAQPAIGTKALGVGASFLLRGGMWIGGWHPYHCSLLNQLD